MLDGGDLTVGSSRLPRGTVPRAWLAQTWSSCRDSRVSEPIGAQRHLVPTQADSLSGRSAGRHGLKGHPRDTRAARPALARRQ